jgi:hypothetical protein
MRREDMEADEQQVAIGGAQYNRAGCLLVPLPLFRVKSAGALVVTNRRIQFRPILFYHWLTKGFDIELDRVAGATAEGGNMELNVWTLVSIGKRLKIQLKDGKSYTVRSTEADLLAEAINGLLERSGS